MYGADPSIGLCERLRERILVLDGAAGTQLAKRHPELVDIIKTQGSGCLSLSHPKFISQMHTDYLLAGADIISTNSFDFGADEDQLLQAAQASALLARQAVDELLAKSSTADRWVAGVIGPGRGRCPDDVRNSKFSGEVISVSTLLDSYRKIVRGLMAGRVDLFLVETIVGSAQAAAVCRAIADENKDRVPVWLSVTLDPATGCLLSGERLGEFVRGLPSPDLFALGINCVPTGPMLQEALAELSRFDNLSLSVHPSTQSEPHVFAESIAVLANLPGLNIAGSCCGSSPEHTRVLASRLVNLAPRPV